MDFIYIQKYSRSLQNGATTSAGPRPIFQALNNIIADLNKQNLFVGLILSPGFLSRKDTTAHDLIGEMKKIDECFILQTMTKANGDEPREFLKKALNDSFPGVNIGDVQLIPTSAKDHRKLWFIYTANTENTASLNKNEIQDFLDSIEIQAMSIGSSNFSKSTYLQNNKQNEADVIFFKEQAATNPNISVNGIATMLNESFNSTNSAVPTAILAQTPSIDDSFLVETLRQTLDDVLE